MAAIDKRLFYGYSGYGNNSSWSNWRWLLLLLLLIPIAAFIYMIWRRKRYGTYIPEKMNFNQPYFGNAPPNNLAQYGQGQPQYGQGQGLFQGQGNGQTYGQPYGGNYEPQSNQYTGYDSQQTGQYNNTNDVSDEFAPPEGPPPAYLKESGKK